MRETLQEWIVNKGNEQVENNKTMIKKQNNANPNKQLGNEHDKST